MCLRLYKYTDFKGALASLQNQTLRLKIVKAWNDPFESDFSGWIREEDSSLEELKTKAYLIKQKLSNQYAAVCFTTVQNDIIMWSHYADDHKGICLEFETCKSDNGFNGEDLFKVSSAKGEKLREVNYMSMPSERILANFKDNEHEEYHKILATKGLQWSYEKEWRYISYFTEAKEYLDKLPKILDDPNQLKNFTLHMPEYKDKTFNKERLISVSFGMRAGEKDLNKTNRVFDLLEQEYPQVKTFQMARNVNRFQINAVPWIRENGQFYRPEGRFLPEKY